jgi:hypothetical protein
MKQILLMIAVVALVGCGKPLIANPIVEKAIRSPFSLNKPTGELTKADLEKATKLGLRCNQLTSVKALEKLTQLTELYLRNNPDLTKAQIAELQKALPKCEIIRAFE